MIKQTARLEDVAATLGVDELEDLAKAAEAIDALLAPSENPQPDDLRNTFLAIEAAAVGADRGVVIFIDEAHRLATNWSSAADAERVKDLLGEVMRKPGGRTVLLIAGSETRVMEDLFGSGSALEHLGTPFALPDIAREDWIPALRERFAEVGLTIREPQLGHILDATQGHPQVTMRVCARARAYCADSVDDEVSDLAVENGIREGLAGR
ncbi:MAG: AAA family ATPase [Actinobacteria bacterium]|nr:AAA family ATPase [Actinomycetota bacterium]